jgi:hypothetical protein
VGAELRAAAAWPVNGVVEPVPIEGTEGSAFPQDEHAFPVRHAGELLGAISVVSPPGEPLAVDQSSS